ncbi:glycosyltransferase [Paraburkholderia sp. CNPSo 3281]|uniref:glycosyltransferase n=1 Tax=Paraburkholderia sp. CNPSo 3281 TaxID=2940933 RepID=UPI0020B83D94|nr:glycosyltransferase [Paraburkholderia sp. CNPSo 3281]MCP3720345.1 glycosyltransferase [Paraburkholderia sp. CNPSo 3281]
MQNSNYEAQDSIHEIEFELRGKKIAVLAAVSASGEQGGAERFYTGVAQGFRDLGCDADLIEIRADESTFDQIINNYQHCKELDLSKYDMVVSTKVPTYAARHPRHVLFLVHTVRVFDDMFSSEIPHPTYETYVQRARIHHLDYEAIGGLKARFAIGHEVAKRLYRWRGIEAEPLHPPLGFTGFRRGEASDYFFLPGRLHTWKRVDLIIKAIRQSKLNLKFLIAGTGSAESDLKQLAGNDPRIKFLGRISDEQLVELYAGALAVPFVPVREDYGYITLEAFASGKPVVTCTDSGEPTYFVRNLETGLIAQPNSESLCKALEWMYQNREQTAEMGLNGMRLVEKMSWKKTAAALAAAGFAPPQERARNKSRVIVLDMQPIDPPIGGGRLRLLGLYHNLGENIECRYVGTYDWPGEPYRAHTLSPGLFEIDVPLSNEHHAAAAALSGQANGKVVIDVAFSSQGRLSPDYLATARQEIANADVVIFSHPWIFPLVRDYIRPNQIVIYDSQNVEGYLRAQLLDESNPVEAKLLRQVAQDEYDVGRRADWILACSHEDLLRFNRIYGFSPARMRVVPNGVMAYSGEGSLDKHEARRRLGLGDDAFVAIFIGSSYGPNVEAGHFIAEELAPAKPNVTFVIAGGVGTTIEGTGKNVIVTGFLNEAQKLAWLTASDIAINPMLSGSGTNIKMFDFMASSLPVVTTAVGARGIETGGRKVMIIAEPVVESFGVAIDGLNNKLTRERLAREARRCVEDGYAWERISNQLGVFIESRQRMAGQPRPKFSVVIPTYERHHQLKILIACLQSQIERDFEVIVVDQSAERWLSADESFGYPMTYYHSPVKGAVRARNTGAMLAQGEIIAFVDDDCQPREDWLLNARPYFSEPDVVGIEGRIESDHLDDPEWRPVSNVGFEGIGFMTANLFVKSAVFQYLGGFDLQFDHPHFREDTDIGWRMLHQGAVPYGHNIVVFHPAQPRSLDRESHAARAHFFEKDALLYKKHPERYQMLYDIEKHYEATPGFREHLIRGFHEYSVPIPDWIMDTLFAHLTDDSGCSTSRPR